MNPHNISLSHSRTIHGKFSSILGALRQRRGGILAVLLAALLSSAIGVSLQRGQATAAFAVITVTGTADGALASLAGNGTCDLREAIQAANTNAAVGECTAGAAGLDTINFNLPGPSYTINVAAGGLPVISQPVMIEGTPFAGSPDRVELNGAGAGANVDGLRVTAGGSTIRNLVINRFGGDGIELNGSSFNFVEGCYIGTDTGGTAEQGNAIYGINIVASANNMIGGAADSARNVISGNKFGGVQIDFNNNTVQGNYIGTDKDGEIARGNSGHGITVQFAGAANNTILGNTISGNTANGIRSFNGASGTVIKGNKIGTDKGGNMMGLGNTADGVAIQSGTNNTVGGTSSADRNVISGNKGTGLVLSVVGVTVQGNYIGTNSAGTAALGNSFHGIIVGGNTTIGGTSGTTPGGNCTGACNLISGNGQNGIVSNGNTLVQGNYIGTDVTGNVDLGNVQSGIVLSNSFNGITVGGTTPAARNLISGNNEHGVYLIGGGATVQGNYIGTNAKGYIDTDATGINDLGNAQTGVVMANFSANNLIGGTEEGARNLISGNNGDGICACSSIFSPSTNTIRGNLIGTDMTGTLDRGNTGNGISTGGGSVVVGGLIISGNIISGNDGAGINSTTPATIQGNYIGTDITGLLPLGNGLSGGIYINGGINVIGGTDTGARNVISANSGNGITIKAGATTTVQGNYIGTNKAGLTGSGLGNNLNGIKLGDAGQGVSNVTIGGNTDAAANRISGNLQNGIELTNSSSNINIKGNYIGQNTLNGVQATQVNSANGAINIGGTAAGEGNTIIGNGENGVQVRTTIGVAIRGNAIYDNTKLGIDLAPTLPGGTVTPNDAGDGDGGSNLLQNFPVLNAITEPCTITGSLDTTTISPANPARIEFFANTACDTTGNGEGEVYLDFVVLTAPGSFSRSFTPVAGKNVITATATDNNGNTSEFSACRTAPVNQAPVIAPASVARTEGQPGANSTIANITDTNQASNTLGITINGQPISPSPTVTVAGVTISNLAITPAGALAADVVAACGATSASFALAATDNCGLTTPGALTVTVNPAPAPMANAGIDQAMCSAGATTAFTLAGNAANGAAAWSVVSGPVSVTNPGALNSTAVFTGAGTATLRLTVTGSCATAADEVVLTVNPVPNADAGPDRTLTCAATSVTLNGSSTTPGASFSWSGPGGFTSNAAAPVVSAAGVYTLTVTTALGCVASDTVAVTGDSTAPNADAGADKTLTCSTTSVTLNGSSTTPGAAFSWSGPGGFTSNAATPAVNAAGLYTLTVTNPANGCTASDSITVTANTAVPDATITVVNEVCANAAGVAASVPDAGPGAAYVWTLTNGTVTSGQGSRSISFTAGATGNISITVGVQGANDCFASNTKAVAINPSTAISTQPAPQAVCAGATATFAVTATGTSLSYQWRKNGAAIGGATGATFGIAAATASDDADYDVVVTGACGAATSAVAHLTVNSAPSITSQPASQVVCENGSVSFTAAASGQPAASVQWQVNAGAGFTNITVATSATYAIAAATSLNGNQYRAVFINSCGTATTSPATLTVQPATAVTAPPSNQAVCFGSSTPVPFAVAAAGVNLGYAWTLDGNSIAGASANIAIDASSLTVGNHTVGVTVTGDCGAPVAASATLTVNANPSAAITAPVVVCFNSTGNAASVPDAGPGGAYVWTLTNGTVTSGQGSRTITFTAGAAGSVSITAAVQAANDCFASSSKTVVIDAALSPAISGPSEICEGVSATLDAGAGYNNYLWSNGATTQTIAVTPNATTTYTVTVTNANGCSGTGAKTVTVNPRPVVAVNSPVVCASATPAAMIATVTSGTAPFNYLWSGPGGFAASTQTINVSAAGVYTASVTDSKGCVAASASGTLTVNPAPDAAITALAAVCASSTGAAASVANAGAGASYNWTIAGGTIAGGQNTPAITWTAGASGSATIGVTVTNAAGCATTGSKTVAINPPTTATALASLTVNAGAPASFTTTASGTGPFGFAWKKGLTVIASGGNVTIASTATASTLNIASAATADADGYSVEVMGACGTAVQTATLTVNAGCAINIAPGLLLDATAGVNYNQTITASGGTAPYTFTVSSTGGPLPGGLSLAASGALSGKPEQQGSFTFTVKATDAANCMATKSYTLTVVCPTIMLAALPNGLFNKPYNGDLNAQPSGGNYTYAVVAGGDWPAGLSLNVSTGKITGRPTAVRSYTFTIRVTGFGACSVTREYTLRILRDCDNDFDGDRLSDLVVWRLATGQWLIKRSSDGQTTTINWGERFYMPAAADYDGDGLSDAAIFTGNGRWRIKPSAGGAEIVRDFGQSGDWPVPADFDGDGKADLAVFRGSEGKWRIRRSSNQTTQVITWGTPGFDVPVVGDYDGDGKADAAVFRPGNGRWYIKRSSDGASVERAWGAALAVPLPADYDGDGKTDIAIWRGLDGQWQILRSSSNSAQTVNWGSGLLADLPVPADYDGDGKADLAVWRPADGMWRIRNSADGSTRNERHGQLGDLPISARQQP